MEVLNFHASLFGSRCRGVIWLALLGCTGPSVGLAVEPPPAPVIAPLVVPEYTAKAGYLLTMSRYVEWPTETFAQPTDPLVFGVLGANPFGDVLARTLHDMKSQGRPIELRYVRTVEEAARCQIVFIARLPENNVAAWLRELRGKPVLTVTESEQGIAEGAVLTFVIEKIEGLRKAKFQASLPNAKAAGLRLSAQMLEHAKQVYREPVESTRTP